MISSWTALALVDAADIGGKSPGKIVARRDVAQVVVQFIGTADHIFPVFESAIKEDYYIAITDEIWETGIWNQDFLWF
jgi:hypothetical protein